MPLDEADLKKIAEILDGKIGALKIDEIRQGLTALDGKIGTAAEEIGKIKAAPAVKPDDKPADKTGKPDAKIDDATATRLATLEAQVRDAEKARLAAETRARDTSRDTALNDLLSGKVAPERVQHARAYLLQTAGLTFDEKAGDWRMPGDIAGVKQLVPLADGVGKWLASEDAKPYLPPVNTGGGTGDRGPIGGRTAPQGGQIKSIEDLLTMVG